MKKIFIAIYLFTIIDVFATITALKAGYIEEANPLFNNVLPNHPAVTGVIVCICTGILLFGIYKIRHRVRWVLYPMLGVLVVKTFIICLHINWVSQVIKG